MADFHTPIGSFEDGRIHANLSPFIQSYIDAIFFTCTGSDNKDEGLGEGTSFAMLAEVTLDKIVNNCNAFIAANKDLLDEAYQQSDYRIERYTENQAGCDLWFTQNGHGVGFWSRDLGGIGQDLTDKAKECDESDLYRGDDGLLYLS